MATLRTVDAQKDKAKKHKRDADEPILADARTKFRRFAESEGPLRQRMRDDQKFSANLDGRQQWDQLSITIREKEERPWLSVDRLSQPIYSLVNQQRESGAAIQVQPVDDGADPETAEVIQGITRNIENQSRAKLAYMWAFEGAVRMGRAFVRIVPEFVVQPNKRKFADMAKRNAFDPHLFDQDLRIKRVLNPFTVYPDPSCEEPDYSDARDYFITQDLSLDAYRAQYGKDSVVNGLEDFSSLGDNKPYWVVDGGVRLAEHYTIKSEYEEIVLVRDAAGNPLVTLVRDLPKLQDQLAAQRNFIRGDIEQRRNLEVRQIHWYKINGVEVLQQREVPGKWIPIVPVIGEELFVDGERDYRGIIRGAKEAAKGYNFQVTALIEAVNLMPKAPFVIAAGQIKGHEEQWKNANTVTYSALVYNAVDVSGRPVPPPQRNPAMPPIQPLVAAILQMDNDIKAATRYFDASLGKAGPEESGRAIAARQRQGDIATSDFSDNFRNVSLTHIGRILVDQIPYYYDNERIARIVGTDEQPKTVKLNAPYVDPVDNKEKHFRMDTGNYDVTVTAGMGFASKQEQTREMLTETLRAAPQIFPVVGDLYMKALGLYDIAKRLEKSLPPELREQKDGEQQPIPPEVRQQIEQIMQEAEALKMALAEAQKKIAGQQIKSESDFRIKTLEIQSRERIEALKIRAAAIEKRLDLSAKEALAAIEADAERSKLAAEAQIEAARLEDEQAHEAAMQATEHDHEVQLQLLKEQAAKDIERHSVGVHEAAEARANEQLHGHKMSEQDRASAVKAGAAEQQHAHRKDEQASAEKQAHEHRKDERVLDAKLTPKPAPKKAGEK